MEASARSRSVTAVLGPTNTGKTHLAIERMLSHDTGMIGLPLRLLAREVYDKIVGRVGAEQVALITGEEKIKPEGARFWVSTVEAMPREINVDFLAIDEIQLAADPERGHTFTDRLLHARGQVETLLLGAGTMREAITDLVPGANFVSRPRLSKLTYTGQKKITRLPDRSAIVAFSANEVYAIAELIRRQRGGAAVVMGALSPRTRNAQVALYQSGDVDYLVATDAVGMGLNLDVDHVAFAAVRKFDGQNHRNLTPAELGQIGGRAGRHLNDGTFGVTGDVEPFENELVEQLENHHFEAIKTLQWRARDLDFSTLENLRESLRRGADVPRLIRARMADDVIALETLSSDDEVRKQASTRNAVTLLWDACQIPDYRKISSQNHAELVGRIFKDVIGQGVIDEDWFARQVAFSDRTDGDIDTLANRIAHIRTWTFISNRPDWLKDPAHWQGRTREIEDNLSDALHECLTQRFVDKRTSALMKGMRVKDELTANIGEDGAIQVENHFVGRLAGFRFLPDTRAEDLHGKAARNAAAQVLGKELTMRVRRVAAAKNEAFGVSPTAQVTWRGEEIACLRSSDDPLKPRLEVLCDEHLQATDREKVQTRVETFINDIVSERLKPLVELSKDQEITGLARGIAFQLIENFGMLRRETVANDIKSLDQTARAQLRRYGVRFGAFNIFFPALLKPGAAELLRALWLLKSGDASGLDAASPPEPPRPGLTSLPAEPSLPDAFYAVSGFHVCGPRAVRADMLERLADQIRVLVTWRPKADKLEDGPPRGATGDGGFTVTPEMMSILGCSTEELGEVLQALGFRSEKRPRPKPVVVTAADEDTAAVPSAATPDDAAQDGAANASDSESSNATNGAETPAASELPASAGDNEATAVTAAQDDTSTVEPKPAEDEAAVAVAMPAESDPLAETPSALPQTADTPDEGVAAEALEPAMAAATQEDPATTTVDSAELQTQSAEAEAVEAGTEEEAMIEVWRPRRRSERGPRHDGRRRGRAPGARGGADRPSGDREQGGGRQRGHGGRRHGQGTQTQHASDHTSGVGRGQTASGSDAASAPSTQTSQAAEGSERSGGRSETRDRRNRQPSDNRGGRDRNRKQRRGGDRDGQRVTSAGPKAKGKGVDPDSPFAALGALKQALEQQMSDDNKPS
ncbi:MAG: helicase-related protein [Pseudomonadota bacterium]